MVRGRRNSPAMVLVQRYATKVHVAILKASRGRVAATMFGSPVFVLVTRGRKSDRKRDTPLLYLRDGRDIVVVASNGGDARPPAWYLNLVEAKSGEAFIGGETFPVSAREVSGVEKQRLWEELVEMYPPYAGYQDRTDRAIPVVVLTPKPTSEG